MKAGHLPELPSARSIPTDGTRAQITPAAKNAPARVPAAAIPTCRQYGRQDGSVHRIPSRHGRHKARPERCSIPRELLLGTSDSPRSAARLIVGNFDKDSDTANLQSRESAQISTSVPVEAPPSDPAAELAGAGQEPCHPSCFAENELDYMQRARLRELERAYPSPSITNILSSRFCQNEEQSKPPRRKNKRNAKPLGLHSTPSP
jgi:hypothetical protein